MRNLIYLFIIITTIACQSKTSPQKQMEGQSIDVNNLTAKQVDSVLIQSKYNYAPPVFLDSSHSQVLLPVTNYRASSSRKSYNFKSTDYTKEPSKYWNILFYDIPSGKSKLLTEGKIRLTDFLVNIDKGSTLLSQSILYKICDTDYT